MKICTGRESNPNLPRGRREFYHWTTSATGSFESSLLQLKSQLRETGTGEQFASRSKWCFQKTLPESLEASDQWTKHTNVLYRSGWLFLSWLYISMYLVSTLFKNLFVTSIDAEFRAKEKLLKATRSVTHAVSFKAFYRLLVSADCSSGSVTHSRLLLWIGNQAL